MCSCLCVVVHYCCVYQKRARLAPFWARPPQKITMPLTTKQLTLLCRKEKQHIFTLLAVWVSSLRRGHANLLCIVPMLADDPRRESTMPLPTVCYIVSFLYVKQTIINHTLNVTFRRSPSRQ